MRFKPPCANVKKLSYRNDYRLRVGKWRIIVTATAEIACIEEVKKREGHTYEVTNPRKKRQTDLCRHSL
jgi:mRNA-degrading endonuclease RelE of RelBE toxin-antitoxin system